MSPSKTTTYTLVASNSAGSDSKSLTLTVVVPESFTWTKSLVYGFGQLLSEEKPTGAIYIQGDQVGSPNLISNAAGQKVGMTKNLPFGERLSRSGVQSTRRFTNHEDQPGSAIYMQARMYLPVYGKFVQVDPAYDQTKDDPESWNLYNYVTNNPITHTDPDGREDNKAITVINVVTQRAVTILLSPYNIYRLMQDGHITVYGMTIKLAGAGGSGQEVQSPGVNNSQKKNEKGAQPGSAAKPEGEKSKNETSPWQLGWQWLTGTGPRTQEFEDGAPMLVLLQQHEHIQATRELVATNIANGGPLEGRKDYKLGGLDGVPKYVRDYSTLLTFGKTGNLAVTYLGSYGLKYSVTNIDAEKHTAIVSFRVWNDSTISSATHPPVIGYTDTWNRFIGRPLDRAISSGPMSKTTQVFTWTETIRW